MSTSNEIKYIPITLIDEPESAMRSEFDDEQFHELTESIRKNGILQAIVVRQKGERYEVVAGHRRYKAAWRCQLAEIPCMAINADDRTAATIKVHENLVRADINVVDEAKFIAETIVQLGVTEQEYADMIAHTVQYVRDRLQIAAMPDYMISALRSDTLKIGVALALMDIESDETRKAYTQNAINEGTTVSAAKDWVRQYHRMYTSHVDSGHTPDTFVAPTEPPVIYFNCERCGQSAPTTSLRFARVHLSECPNDISS